MSGEAAGTPRRRLLQGMRPPSSWDAWIGGIADVPGPLLTEVPPKLGSKRLADLLDQVKVAWRLWAST